MDALKKVPLRNSQHPYRLGRSTDTPLHELTGIGIIQKTFDEKETVICAFLDILSGFDNTSHVSRSNEHWKQGGGVNH